MNRTDDLDNRMAGLLLGRSGRGNPGRDLAPPPKVSVTNVRVRALGEFYVDGKPVRRFDVVTVDSFTASDLAARGRAELL